MQQKLRQDYGMESIPFAPFVTSKLQGKTVMLNSKPIQINLFNGKSIYRNNSFVNQESNVLPNFQCKNVNVNVV